MADVTLKQHDTRPVLGLTLNQTVNGVLAPIDLTTATGVSLKLKEANGSTTGGGTCSIADAVNGLVTYTPQTADTATAPRTWQGECEIAWSDGGVETVPNGDYITVQIIGDLG